MPYVELHCHSHYSLLDGASSPEALLDRAVELGYTALAITDHDGLYGAIPFYLAARERGIKPIIGAEVTLADGSHLTLLARDRTGYANLCGLLSQAGLAGSKRHPLLAWEVLASRAGGLIALSGCDRGALPRLLMEGRLDEARELAGRCREVFGSGHFFVELQRHRLPEDARRNYHLTRLARRLRLPTVATHNVHYATRERHRLHDVLNAIAQRTTVGQARLRANSEYYLPSPAEAEAWHRAHPEAIAATAEIAGQCQVDLDFSGERLPEYPVPPGETAFSYLYQLCHEGLRRKYQPVTPEAARQLQYELGVIQEAGLAGYFLIVWDIVRFARQQKILARGRGSAASSIVAYVLDITAVDPLAHRLLFERFLTPGSRTMPDIDIDFAADRREEVIQYVYRTYGQERTGMVATMVTYHARSAVRDVAKALGFPLDVVDQVAKMVPVTGDVPSAVQRLAGEAAHTGPWQLLTDLAQQIEGTPRHLGIHSGGMILTGAPLSEIVPLERATMPGRVVVQWDKYAVEDAGLIKFDLLGLRALAVVDEVVRTVSERRGIEIDLDALPLDDPAIYDILCRGDTVGAFQVESRAQAQMLPHLAPRRFEDIVVAVALIRPGPLQGNMVHPYLRRRREQEPVTCFHPSLEPVLAETLGVILFQEQVLRVAMTVAGF
ncbi:MAG: DNA polymerase III subunit alpha, partial [Anaerolineae bacterium]|nr:DNA polymerase III subunit alpha [Anaerolineae bacterium]